MAPGMTEERKSYQNKKTNNGYSTKIFHLWNDGITDEIDILSWKVKSYEDTTMQGHEIVE